jgi:hypothetical protein
MLMQTAVVELWPVIMKQVYEKQYIPVKIGCQTKVDDKTTIF